MLTMASGGSWLFPTNLFEQVAQILSNETTPDDENGSSSSTDPGPGGGEGAISQMLNIKMEPESTDTSFEQVKSPASDNSKSGKDKGDKICGVCGDKALGCNFDAISCESCKAFFRRNALKEKKTTCLFSGNCKIDLHTRRFCPHCRLQKCFNVGMKKDLILGDEERKRRMQKVQTNRSKKVKRCPSQPDTSLGNPSTPISAPPSPVESIGAAPSTPEQPATPQSVNSDTPVDTSNMLCLLRNARAIFSTDALLKPPVDYTVRTMTQEEELMLQELLQVYDLSFTADIEPLIHVKRIDPSLNQLVNQSSITVLRLIKFAKRLEDFARLPQDCQIGILKGTWIHILLLRSVSLYDIDRDMWTTPRGEIPTEILKNATGYDDLHDRHVSYSKSIKTMVPDDLTIVILMIVIVLFAPESPHVTMRETVSNIQDKYLVLLKHYLEHKYTYHRSSDLFPKLMMKLNELKDLAEIHGKYLLDVNPGEIEPIMLEILDLK